MVYRALLDIQVLLVRKVNKDIKVISDCKEPLVIQDHKVYKAIKVMLDCKALLDLKVYRVM